MSTKTTDKKKAQKIAWAAEEASRTKVTQDQARKIISKVVEEIQGEIISHESSAVYFARWKARRGKELAGTTVDRFGDVLESLKKHFGESWELPLSDITPAQVAAWRDAIAGQYAPVTVNLYLKVFKQAMNDAWSDGLIAHSPSLKIKLLKITKTGSVKKVFTADQYTALIAEAEGEWKGIIHAGAFTGQRLSDICSMRLEEIVVDADQVWWWRFKSRKTGAQMAIPLPAPFISWYRAWIKSRKIASLFVFPDAQDTLARSQGKPSSLSNKFHRIMSSAGLVERRDNNVSKGIGRSGRRATSELSFHSFRHTCTTWLKSCGLSESVAMAFVGHESKAVNRSYTHLPESVLLDAMRLIEKFPKVA